MNNWTQKQEDYIIDNYATGKIATMVFKTGKSEGEIRAFAKRKGLRRTKKAKAGATIKVAPMKPLVLPCNKIMQEHAAKARSTKTLNPIADKKPVRINDKTVIYVAADATPEQIEDAVWKYNKNTPPLIS